MAQAGDRDRMQEGKKPQEEKALLVGLYTGEDEDFDRSMEELGELAKLDLSAVAEFKRSSNGTVEVKFIDRLAALQWLMDRAEEDPKAQRLYEALEGAAGQVGEEK